MPQSSAISCTVILFSFFSRSNFFKDAEIARLVISLMIFSPVRRRSFPRRRPRSIFNAVSIPFFYKKSSARRAVLFPVFLLVLRRPAAPVHAAPRANTPKNGKTNLSARRTIAINRTYFVFFRRNRLTFRAVSYKIIFV